MASFGNPPVMLFNKTENICRILEKKYVDPLINMLFKDFSSVIKLKKCPLPKGFYFHAVNFTLDTNKFPRFFQSTAFYTIMDFFVYENEKKVLVIKTKFIGNLINLNPIRLKNMFSSQLMF